MQTEHECNAAVLENEFVRLAVSVAHKAWQLEDRRGGVTWGNTGRNGGWLAQLSIGESGAVGLPLALREVEGTDDALRCSFEAPAGPQAAPAIVFRLIEDAVHVYVVPEDRLSCPSVRLFEHGLDSGAEEDGQVALPISMGFLARAAGTKPFAGNSHSPAAAIASRGLRCLGHFSE